MTGRRLVHAAAPAGLAIPPALPGLLGLDPGAADGDILAAVEALVARVGRGVATIPNVELLEVGEDWECSTGVFTWTADDLASAVASQDDPGVRTPVIKLGHTDPRFDGQPSIGRVVNLAVTNRGQTLVGDYAGIPAWLADVLPSAYPRRSTEGWFGFTTRTGTTWPFVLTAVALLGEAYPAIMTLEDIAGLFGAEPPELVAADDDAAGQAATPAAAGMLVRAERVRQEDGVPRWRRRQAQAAATPFADLPLAERDRPWSASDARTNLRAWASSDGSGDLDTLDMAKYSRGFFWMDGDTTADPDGDGYPDNLGDYKLCFADVIDGKLTAVPRGVFGCAGAMMGARGGVDIPSADEADVKAHVEKYYAKMATSFGDDTITAPWANAAAGAPLMSAEAVAASLSVEDVRREYYEYSLTAPSPAGGTQYWWWIREMLVSPAELIIDDDDTGALWRLPYTIGDNDTISFGKPTKVEVQYVDLPADQQAAAAAAARARRPGQLAAASWADPNAAGRPARSQPRRAAASAAATGGIDMQVTAEMLAALGLAPEASEAEITDAVIRLAGGSGDPAPPAADAAPAAPQSPAAPAPAAAPAPTAAPAAPAPTGQQDAPPAAPAPADQPLPAAASAPSQTGGTGGGFTLPAGMVLVDQAQWDEVRAGAQTAQALAAERATSERARILDAAVQAGKFPPSRRPHYEALLSADPEGTRNMIAALAEGTIPVGERGRLGGEVDVAATAYPDSWKPYVTAAHDRAGNGRVTVAAD